MSEEIINRVANSKLKTIDLEEFYPEGPRVLLDISQWLKEGLVLLEKDFRSALKEHDWSQYRDSYVALTCSSDAIIPGWAYMLTASYLNPVAKKVVVGDLETLETLLYQDLIGNMDLSAYQDLPVIIKGCSRKPVPENAYIQLINTLQPIAKNIMYGEACSSVPLYKR